MRKYASLESAQILDLKGSKQRNKTASLEKIGEFEDYRTEDGYLYARIRAISSRVNKNHDGWPSVELAGGKESFDKYANAIPEKTGFTVTASKDDSYGFSTFLGKPVFVDHNNSNPDRARGVIVDAKLHVEDHKTSAHDPYYSSDDVDSEHIPPTWVELLLEVDAKSFPKLAKAILDGAKDSKKGIDGFSMGCDVEKSVCNVCKNAAVSPDEFCNHVKLKGAHFDALDKRGKKISKRSYENCYGIKFFEISAVFDPADETALVREVKASVEKEADIWSDCVVCGGTGQHYGRPCEHCGGTGRSPGTPQGRPLAPPPSLSVGPTLNPPNTVLTSWNDRLRTAEAPLPQNDMMTVPEYVDTMREEDVCPVCGSNMEEGHQCEVCGYVAPPEGLDNPDLDQAQTLNAPEDTPQMDSAKDFGQPGPTELGNPESANPNNLMPTASVSDVGWNIHHPKLGGTINPVEKPIRPGSKPGTNEPRETIISDQDTPVTNRTAASMIAAANKENTMGNARTAADAPTADTRADARVDATGVGGVMDSNNESASAADTQTNVEGKGGVIQDSNQEASKADHQESLPTASREGDDAGFNKDKTTDDSGHTKTFPNSNEPNSAVTNQAFPTEDGQGAGNWSKATASTWKIVGGDDRAYPTEDTGGDGGLGGGGSAKGGAEPADPVGKAEKRVDLLEHTTSPENNSGPTKTWSGTDGNGVTKQQDPVTRQTLEGEDIINLKKSFVEMLRIADTEVELGIITPEEKYERLAELEDQSLEAIKATAATLSKVKTAGLRKNAATKQGGVGRVPSMRTQREASVQDADESLFM